MSGLYTTPVDSLTTSGTGGTHVQKRIGEISAVATYAAKRVADGLEALMLVADKIELEEIQEWPSSRGFQVLIEPDPDRAEKTHLHLQLVEDRYRDVFRALCDDVGELLVSASHQREAIRSFHQRLVRWQSFLQKHGPEGLGEQARCGLFGELLVLRDLLLPLFEDSSALRAWRGCKRAHQDFQFPDRALEVKTTRATIPDRVSVSNVQQLDGEGMEHMFLTVVHVHENDTTGETLPDMVDRLRAALEDDARDLLDVGLGEVGYLDAHRDLYARTLYQRLGLLHFEVRDEFPRLKRDQVPEGVKSVRYEISMDACKPFKIDQAELLKSLAPGVDDDCGR